MILMASPKNSIQVENKIFPKWIGIIMLFLSSLFLFTLAYLHFAGEDVSSGKFIIGFLAFFLFLGDVTHRDNYRN